MLCFLKLAGMLCFLKLTGLMIARAVVFFSSSVLLGCCHMQLGMLCFLKLAGSLCFLKLAEI
jgi:hypothetical protein